MALLRTSLESPQVLPPLIPVLEAVLEAAVAVLEAVSTPPRSELLLWGEYVLPLLAPLHSPAPPLPLRLLYARLLPRLARAALRHAAAAAAPLAPLRAVLVTSIEGLLAQDAPAPVKRALLGDAALLARALGPDLAQHTLLPLLLSALNVRHGPLPSALLLALPALARLVGAPPTCAFILPCLLQALPTPPHRSAALRALHALAQARSLPPRPLLHAALYALPLGAPPSPPWVRGAALAFLQAAVAALPAPERALLLRALRAPALPWVLPRLLPPAPQPPQDEPEPEPEAQVLLPSLLTSEELALLPARPPLPPPPLAPPAAPSSPFRAKGLPLLRLHAEPGPQRLCAHGVGGWVALGGRGGLRVWDASRLRAQAPARPRLHVALGDVGALTALSDTLLALSVGGRVKLLEAAQGAVQGELEGAVAHLQPLSPQGLLGAGKDLLAWDLRHAPRPVWSLPCPAPVRALVRLGEHGVATGDARGRLCLWDVRFRLPLRTLLLPRAPVHALAPLSASSLLVAAPPGLCALWRVDEGRAERLWVRGQSARAVGAQHPLQTVPRPPLLPRLDAHASPLPPPDDSPLRALLVAPGGGLVWAGDAQGLVRQWELPEPAQSVALPPSLPLELRAYASEGVEVAEELLGPLPALAPVQDLALWERAGQTVLFAAHRDGSVQAWL